MTGLWLSSHIYLKQKIAFQAGYGGSIPFTRSDNQLNKLAKYKSEKKGASRRFCHKMPLVKIRRNPPLPAAVVLDLWRACGQNSADSDRIAIENPMIDTQRIKRVDRD